MQFGGLAPPPWLASWTDSVRGGAHLTKPVFTQLSPMSFIIPVLKGPQGKIPKKKVDAKAPTETLPLSNVWC